MESVDVGHGILAEEARSLQLVVEPDDTDRKLAKDADGFPLAPDLGVSTNDGGGGARVRSVTEGGAAYAAGINVDDVILAVRDMRGVPAMGELPFLSSSGRPGRRADRAAGGGRGVRGRTPFAPGSP